MDNQKIYEAISNVMEEVGAIGKNKKCQQGNGFMYRGIDDVMNALNPAFVKFKVFVTPEILEHIREDRTSQKGNTLIYSVCKIKYTFYTLDGSSVSATVIGEAMDSGDKSMNKAMAVAFKYACFQVFCIPTEEMVDPDSEVHSVVPKNTPINTDSQPSEEPKENNNFAKHDEQVGIFHQEIQRTGKSLKWFLDSSKVKDAKYIKGVDLEKYIAGLKSLPDKV